MYTPEYPAGMLIPASCPKRAMARISTALESLLTREIGYASLASTKAESRSMDPRTLYAHIRVAEIASPLLLEKEATYSLFVLGRQRMHWKRVLPWSKWATRVSIVGSSMNSDAEATHPSTLICHISRTWLHGTELQWQSAGGYVRSVATKIGRIKRRVRVGPTGERALEPATTIISIEIGLSSRASSLAS